MKKLLFIEAVLLVILIGAWIWTDQQVSEAMAEALDEPAVSISFEEQIEQDLDAKFEEWRQHLIDVIATIIMVENGQKHSDCMQATGQTAINRLRDGRWGDTIDEVYNYPNAYSHQDNGEPTAECYAVAEWVVDHPNVFPTNMFYFREGQYHTFGTAYTSIEGTYFSTEGDPIWD